MPYIREKEGKPPLRPVSVFRRSYLHSPLLIASAPSSVSQSVHRHWAIRIEIPMPFTVIISKLPLSEPAAVTLRFEFTCRYYGAVSRSERPNLILPSSFHPSRNNNHRFASTPAAALRLHQTKSLRPRHSSRRSDRTHLTSAVFMPWFVEMGATQLCCPLP